MDGSTASVIWSRCRELPTVWIAVIGEFNMSNVKEKAVIRAIPSASDVEIVGIYL